MVVIDVDTHWETASWGSTEHPLKPWREELPHDQVETLANAIAGDLRGRKRRSH